MLDVSAPPEGDEVLGQRSRARLFAALSDLRRPATTAELARAVALRPNGVRVHLAALERAGLVVRAHTEGRRGRPADLWAVSPGARPAGQAPSAYQDLAGFLARAIAAGASDPPEMRAVGRALGRELADTRGPDGVEGVGHALAAMGFAPRRTSGPGPRSVFALDNCPYREAARVNQRAVCALHHGITEGLVDALMPAGRLTSFAAEDPGRAGCRVEIEETRSASDV